MNLSKIANKVAELVSDASNVETRPQPGNAYALVCRMRGRIKSVLFDSTGLVGANNMGMYADWPKSDFWIAGEIAKELRK